MATDIAEMERMAERVTLALEAADLDAFAAVLDPNVRWGAPGDSSSGCQNRKQVLNWYRKGKAAGVRARVAEIVVAGEQLLVGLAIAGRDGAAEPSAEALRWQVLTVRSGLVVEIVGFDERAEAAAWAGVAER